jgi:1-acyl-sn-glycerol-3-phosphate acyltransferase
MRRIVLWPLPVIGGVLYALTAPLWFLAATVLSYKLPGKLRLVRSLGLATVYLFVEGFVVVSAFGLWVASGFGWRLRSDRFEALHYEVLRIALGLLVGAGRRLFVLEIHAVGPPLPAADDGNGAPLIVMSRHAGPADSILLLHEVMTWHGRRPRIVMKDLLQLDPAFDILLNRLPNRFIPHGGASAIEAISELATGMTSADAFVIFPEGGNFTEHRRVTAIARLRAGGHEAAARRAEELHNVLPPRPAGTLAAFTAAPDADAVFVAHTGLDQIAGVGDLWTAIPDNKVLHINWRVVTADEVPNEPAAQEELLLGAWERIDHWIDATRPGRGLTNRPN